MLNRREFIGAGVGAVIAAKNALALPVDKFRWSISSHMFTPMKPHPESGIKMAARFGFHGIEPWGNEMENYLSKPPDVFKKLLDEAGIGISSVASGGQYFDTTKIQATIENNASNAKYAAFFGVKALKCNLNGRMGPENLSVANGKILAKNLNEVGKRTLEHGVKFAFHPHAWSIVDRKAEVEMMLEMTDPKLVFLTLDTCHASIGGIDPVKFVREHYARIAHFHFKDTLPVWNSAKGWQGPPPSKEEEIAMAKKLGVPVGPDPIYQRLGTGGVDFPSLIALLRERNYDGWISLDFNAADMNPGVTIEQDMTAHRKYLVDALHASMKAMKA
jgi:sugar phosphate isomerase/epimerase